MKTAAVAEKPAARPDMRSECWACKHKREVPGNTHFRCVKPDPAMTGDEHGIENGWFIYPHLFDPVWKTKACRNYEAADDA